MSPLTWAWRRVPWPVRLLLHADDELDLIDRTTGHADHGKIIGFFTFLAFYALIWFDKLPPFEYAVLMMFTAYGWAGLRLYTSFRGRSNVESPQLVPATDPYAAIDNPDDPRR